MPKFISQERLRKRLHDYCDKAGISRFHVPTARAFLAGCAMTARTHGDLESVIVIGHCQEMGQQELVRWIAGNEAVPAFATVA